MDLVKALRAMQYTPAWAESVEAACLFAGKEYGPPVLQAMTKLFLDALGYDPATLEVSVPVELGGPLLEAVTQWQPENTPEPVPEPEQEPDPNPDLEDPTAP